MKRTSLFLILLTILLQDISAQPSQAEINKMMKQAQDVMNKYGKDSTVNKAIKDALEKQKRVAEVMKDVQGNNNGVINASYSDPGSYANVDNWRFPPKNTALLSSLPKQILTKTELVNFLSELYTQLAKKLQPGITSSVQSVATKYNNDGAAMGDAAVVGWYTDYREEALLLLIKAASNNPDDGLVLNNCGALLTMSGIEHKAIPILKYALQANPASSMLLNNIGQAYAGLGETDTAMTYLGRCMKIEPEHPEACNTAGQIEATKGAKEKAVEYFEKSIKSAYTKTAVLKMKRLKKDAKVAPLIRPRVKLPEYFNLFKYDLPAQCTRVEDAAVAKAEHAAFRATVTTQAQMYGTRYLELAKKKNGEALKIMNANGVARKLKKDEFMAHPFWGLCELMASELTTDYQNELNDFTKQVLKRYGAETSLLEEEYQSKLKIIKKGFEDREKNCGDGKANTNCPTTKEKCTAYNKLANQYLPKFAALTVDMQKKAVLIYTTYFDELAYWHYLLLHPTGDENFRMRYYEFIMQYMAMMVGVCQTKIIEPCEFSPTTATKDSNAIKDVDCPVDVELGLGMVKVELNCEKFSIRGGEGLIFGYEKKFKTRQSTLSVGIGVKLDLGVKAGPVKAIVGGKATETAFITFDGNNGIADYGLKNEAKLQANVTGVVKKDIGIGSKLGVNSGYDFNEGPFKGLIGPAPEQPLNKNIKVYKPG